MYMKNILMYNICNIYIRVVKQKIRYAFYTNCTSIFFLTEIHTQLSGRKKFERRRKPLLTETIHTC